jgi:hypothetical protein
MCRFGSAPSVLPPGSSVNTVTDEARDLRALSYSLKQNGKLTTDFGKSLVAHFWWLI